MRMKFNIISDLRDFLDSSGDKWWLYILMSTTNNQTDPPIHSYIYYTLHIYLSSEFVIFLLLCDVSLVSNCIKRKANDGVGYNIITKYIHYMLLRSLLCEFGGAVVPIFLKLYHIDAEREHWITIVMENEIKWIENPISNQLRKRNSIHRQISVN